MFPLTLAGLRPVLFVDGLLAGLFIGSSLVEHAAASLPAASWIAYKQAKEKVFGPVMPVLFIGGLAATAAAAAVLPAHVALAAAAGLLALVLAITAAVHLPLNKAFQGWAPVSYPVTWDVSRRRWRRWNLVRTALVIAAFALILTAGS